MTYLLIFYVTLGTPHGLLCPDSPLTLSDGRAYGYCWGFPISCEVGALTAGPLPQFSAYPADFTITCQGGVDYQRLFSSGFES